MAVLTLALGIGANTAIFSLINAIMLQHAASARSPELVPVEMESPPKRRDEGFVCLWRLSPRGRFSGRPSAHFLISRSIRKDVHFPTLCFRRFKNRTPSFRVCLAFVPEQLTVNSGGRTGQGQGLFVSGNFFSALGTRPALGRLLDPTDDSEGAAPALVVSHGFWQSELGGASPWWACTF